MADAPEIKACPKGCPAQDASLEKVDRFQRVMCDCGWHGPFRKNSVRAIAAWNTRATPPASVVEAMERALRVFVHSYTFQTDGIITAFYDAETALADLTAWRAGK